MACLLLTLPELSSGSSRSARSYFGKEEAGSCRIILLCLTNEWVRSRSDMVWLLCNQKCCRKVVSMRHVERQRGKHGAGVMMLRSPRSREFLRSRT